METIDRHSERSVVQFHEVPAWGLKNYIKQGERDNRADHVRAVSLAHCGSTYTAKR